jgi:hypothetical protein
MQALETRNRKIITGIFRELAAVSFAWLMPAPLQLRHCDSSLASHWPCCFANLHAEFGYKVHFRCKGGKSKYFRVVSWATANRKGQLLRGKADIKALSAKSF